MYQPPAPPPAVPHAGRTALIYGVFTGLVLGVIESGVLVYALHGTYYRPLGPLSLPLSVLFWIIAFMVVGAMSARRTGKILTGTLTGLWAGMVGGIISAVTLFAMLMSSIPYYSSYLAISATYLTLLIFLILMALGLGTGLGSLGGLIGQSFSNSTVVPSYPQQQRGEVRSAWTAPRQYDPPQQEQELVQYQQISPSQREQSE